MIKAAIVGMGWWGRTLVEAVAESDQIRFVAGATRTVSPEVKAFSEAQRLTLVDSYEALLADTTIDAVVLATPHSLHSAQTIAALIIRSSVFGPRSHYVVRINEYFGSAPRLSVTGSPSSFFTMLVPCTSDTIL